MATRKITILYAAALLALLPSIAIAADAAKEIPPVRSAPSEKRAMSEDYKKLRIDREKLVIERAQLNIHCLEAKEADKKECVGKKRALREKIETISDKIHDLREKRRAERHASESSQSNSKASGTKH